MSKLFSITCATCQTRLSVRHAAAIGQILACPKCNSMVQVVPPADWRPSQDPKDSRWADTVDDSQINLKISEVGDTPQQGVHTTPRPQSERVSATPSPSETPAAPQPPEYRGEAPAPPDTTTEGGGARSRLITFAGVAFAAMTIGAISIYALRPSTDGVKVADATGAKNTSQGNAQGNQGAGPAKGKSDAQPPAEDSPAASDSNPAAPLPTPADDSTGTDASVSPPETPQPESPPADDPPPSADSGEVPSAPPVGESPTEPPTHATTETPAATPPSVPDEGSPTPMPSPGDAVTTAPTSGEAPLSAEPPSTDASSAVPLPEKPPLRTIDLGARLADELFDVDFKQVGLRRFVNVMTQLSTIPITLDVDALSAAGVDLDVPVTIHLTNAPVQKVLNDALATLGLGYRQVSDQLVVTTQADLSKDRPNNSFRLGPITAEEAEAWQTLIEKLIVPGAVENDPFGTWLRWDDAQGVLYVNQPSAVVRCVGKILQKVSSARAQAPADPDGAVAKGLATAQQKTEGLLDRTVSANFFQEAPLERVLAYLEGAAECRLLVNYLALAAEGIGPELPVRLSVQDAPLASALDGLLGPWNLAVRPIDEDTLEITTRKALLETPDVEVYPVTDILEGGQSSERLLSLVEEIALQAARGPDAAMVRGVYDAPSKCLVVVGPQTEQLKVAEALDRFRDSGPVDNIAVEN